MTEPVQQQAGHGAWSPPLAAAAAAAAATVAEPFGPDYQPPQEPSIRESCAAMAKRVARTDAWLSKVPILTWLPAYQARRHFLRHDLVAGLTTGVVVVPQGMAFALAAGLPPEVGLVSSLFPMLVYAVFGTSRHLSVAPVAIGTLLVAEGVNHLYDPGTGAFVAAAAVVGFLNGLLTLLLGVFRLGFMINFLSRPVMEGFTAAAAVIIAISQSKHVLGVAVEPVPQVYLTLYRLILEIPNASWLTLVMGIGSIVLLKGVERIHKLIPGALLVAVITTGISAGIGETPLLPTTGHIPPGLPRPAPPQLTSFEVVQLLLPTALVTLLIGFRESISVAKTFAELNHYVVDDDQELIALGMANIIGSFFGCYPTTGGLSRTVVNAKAGAATPVAGVVSALVVMVVMLLLTPLFFYLPKAALASLIIVAVAGLIDVKSFKHAYHVRRRDFLLQMFSFLATLLIGVELGVALAVIMSVLMLVQRASAPHFAVLGRLPDPHPVYRNVARFPHAKQIPGLLLLRFDAEMFFANAVFVHDTVLRCLADAPTYPVSVHTLIIDFSAVVDIDLTAVEMWLTLVPKLHARGISLAFASCLSPVRDVLARSGLRKLLGDDLFFLSLEDAVSKSLAARAPSPVVEPAVTKSDDQPRSSGATATPSTAPAPTVHTTSTAPTVHAEEVMETLLDQRRSDTTPTTTSSSLTDVPTLTLSADDATVPDSPGLTPAVCPRVSEDNVDDSSV